MGDRRWRNIGVSHEEAFPAQRPCRASPAARHTIGWKHLGGDVTVQAPSRTAYTAFAHEVEPRLRYALVAACGTQRGVDATVDALEWAWEHWDKVESAHNPAGYLYRVARRRSLRDPTRTFPLLREPLSADDQPWVEPALAGALERLSKKQRLVVVMVEGFGWTHREMAEFLGVGRSTVQKHLERGLTRLRRDLGVTSDV